MQRISPESAVKRVTSLTAVSRGAGTVNGTAMDTKGMGDVVALFIAGTNQAGGTHDVPFEDSADGSTWAALTDSAGNPVAFTQVTTANHQQTFQMLFREGSHRRHIRPKSVVAVAACVGGVELLGFAPQLADLADGAAAYQKIVENDKVASA